MNSTMTMTAPTEQDRAVARRILRRHVGARDNCKIEPTEERFAWRTFELYRSIHRGAQVLSVVDHVLAAVVEGARLGREYRERESGRRS